MDSRLDKAGVQHLARRFAEAVGRTTDGGQHLTATSFSKIVSENEYRGMEQAGTLDSDTLYFTFTTVEQ